MKVRKRVTRPTLKARFLDLERRVAKLELRASVLRDIANHRVLTLLKSFATNPFNDGTLTMTPDSIANATGLNAHDLGRALHTLRQAAFVELVRMDGVGHWRITDDGCAALEGVS